MFSTRMQPAAPAIALTAGMLLAACGAAAPAASKAVPASAPPEKVQLQVAAPGAGFSPVPLYIARDAGYFANHGLSVTINMISAPVANQGLVSGTVDVYHGSSSVITAHLGGSDAIYVAAPSNRSPNMLFGKKGLTSFADLRGKTVALSGPGTTRDIFIRHTLKQQGLEVDKDLRLLYTQGDPAAYAAFTSGNAEATLVAPPYSTQLQGEGYPVLIDYPKEGLHVIEPGIAMSRAFVQKNPNTVTAYLQAYLDGVKRAYDDPAMAKETESKLAKIDDPKVLDSDYQQGTRQWNKNLVIDPADIQLVLDAATDPKAKTAKPGEFYDNSFIQGVNRDYGVKLFPSDIK